MAKMVTGGRASDLKRLQLRMCTAVRVQRQVWGREKRERARERERERERERAWKKDRDEVRLIVLERGGKARTKKKSCCARQLQCTQLRRGS